MMHRVLSFSAGLRGLRTALLVLALVWPGVALADGGFPASTGVIFDAHETKNVYVRTTFGLLNSRDGGGSWRWICGRAMGLRGPEEPAYVVTPKGTLVAATSAGIALSRDGGCTFAFSGGKGTHVLADLAMRSNGEVVGIGERLMISKDDAQIFGAASGPLDAALQPKSVAVAPSEPARYYVTALRGGASVLLASLDGGMSWAERKIDLAGDTPAILGGVDPKNADRVYVRATRLLVTDDAGRTWKKAFEASSPIAAFALSEDGSRVFVGSREGVSSSPTDAFAFTKGSSAAVQCLGTSGSSLWACGGERSGFFVGTSRNGGLRFEPRLQMDEIKGPLECPAETSVAKECPAEWDKIRQELGVPEPGAKHNTGSSGPALYGRSTGVSRSRSGFAAVAGIAFVVLAGYSILKRLRRR